MRQQLYRNLRPAPLVYLREQYKQPSRPHWDINKRLNYDMNLLATMRGIAPKSKFILR